MIPNSVMKELMEPFNAGLGLKDGMKDFLKELFTHLALNLSIAITSSFLALKQKSISSFKMCNNLPWGILVYNVEKSNEDKWKIFETSLFRIS